MVYLLALLAIAALHAALGLARPAGSGPSSIRPSERQAVFLAGTAVVITAVVGTRLDTGTDFARYVEHFRLIGEGVGPFFREPLYTLFGASIAAIGGGAALFLLGLTLLTSVGLLAGVHAFRPAHPFLVVLGLFGTDLVLSQTNGVRQMVAVGLFLPALALAAEGRWWRYTAMVAVAGGFHYVALAFYPLYWLVRLPIGAGLLAGVLVAGLVGMILLPPWYPALMEQVAPLLPDRYAEHALGVAAKGSAMQTGAGVLAMWAVGAASLGWLYLSGELARLSRRERVVVNVAIPGIALNTLLAPLPVVHRLADFLIVAVPLLASVVVRTAASPRERMLIYALFALAFVGRFAWDVISGTHGALPYDSWLLPQEPRLKSSSS